MVIKAPVISQGLMSTVWVLSTSVRYVRLSAEGIIEMVDSVNSLI